MLINKIRGLALFIAIISVAVFTACDSTDPHSNLDGQGIIQMKAASNTGSAKIQSSMTTEGAISVNDGTNQIEIRQVKFFID